jgi:hypothetical protein
MRTYLGTYLGIGMVFKATEIFCHNATSCLSHHYHTEGPAWALQRVFPLLPHPVSCHLPAQSQVQAHSRFQINHWTLGRMPEISSDYSSVRYVLGFCGIHSLYLVEIRSALHASRSGSRGRIYYPQRRPMAYTASNAHLILVRRDMPQRLAV